MFVLVFEQRSYSRIHSYIELRAKTLEAARKEVPKRLLSFLGDDEGGWKSFEDFEEMAEAVANVRLLEIKKFHSIDPSSKAFRLLFEKNEKEDQQRREQYQEQNERAEYERLKAKFGKGQKTDNRVRDKHSDSPVYCEHANEMPSTCPCKLNCYCKFNACRSPNRNATHPVLCDD